MNELSLFTGAGGLLVGRQLGWRPLCAVELDLYARSILLARQDDGSLPPFPIWDDIRTFDGHPWRGYVDIVTGGFPCQDISTAGTKTGISGSRSGLWKEMFRVVSEVRPEFVFIENSPNLRTKGLDVVLQDLASLGFDAEWGVLGAGQVGAPHRRERMWIVGHSDAHSRRLEGVGESKYTGISSASGAVPDGLRQGGWGHRTPGSSNSPGPPGSTDSRAHDLAHPVSERAQVPSIWEHATIEVFERAEWWSSEPRVGRVAHGVAARVDRLKCLGNGQVPYCAATAFTELAKRGGWIK